MNYVEYFIRVKLIAAWSGIVQAGGRDEVDTEADRKDQS